MKKLLFTLLGFLCMFVGFYIAISILLGHFPRPDFDFKEFLGIARYVGAAMVFILGIFGFVMCAVRSEQ